jgi:hypothetical protein
MWVGVDAALFLREDARSTPLAGLSELGAVVSLVFQGFGPFRITTMKKGAFSAATRHACGIRAGHAVQTLAGASN